jgi:hypothetical protein
MKNLIRSLFFFAYISGLLIHQSVFASDIPHTIVRADFSSDGAEIILSPEDAKTAKMTTNPAEEVNGKRSLKGDSLSSSAEWNEFLHSKAGLFAPDQGYQVSFDYKVISRSANAYFYTLFRNGSGGGNNIGWKQWNGESGDTGHIQTTLSVGGQKDYYLIIGIYNRGAIAINNITIVTDPASIPPAWPAPVRTWKSNGNVSYYVDSLKGNDANNGFSPEHAWRSLYQVNSGEFAPGDRIMLKSGSQWSGYLSPGGSGSADHPILLQSYGTGPKPKIDARGKYQAALFLKNSEYWTVRNLDISNNPSRRLPSLYGVQVTISDFGTAHQIKLIGLNVHDVMGTDAKSEGGGGINCSSGGDKVKSSFDGLLIENCTITRTDRNGITMGAYYPRPQWPWSKHVVIRGNYLEDIGGDGIVPIGCDGALVEHNVLHGGRMRAEDYAAGIWPWSCDNTVLQYNEVSGMKGTNDGEGYDSDYNSRNTLFQYNYSHDNDGGFMLICDDGGQQMPWNIGNTGTIIRYNVSRNDGLHTFNISGPCQNTLIYNNVFYVGKELNVALVASGNWGNAWPKDTKFLNNVFYVDGKARFDFGGMTNVKFENNAFFGNIQSKPDDPHAVFSDPLLAGAPLFLKPAAFMLRSGSPLIGAGRIIPNNGGKDFQGNPVSAETPPAIGAYQPR